MPPSLQNFRENVFGVFYVMTESSHSGRSSDWGVVWCGILYLLDAGQVLRALFVKDYGWTGGVAGLMSNLDFVSFITNLVDCTYSLASNWNQVLI